jgi:transposase
MDRESLEALLGEGLSLEQIGRRVGRHHSTVSYWLAKYGLVAANSAKHSPRGGIDEEHLRRLVARGLSIRQLAGELGVSYSTVRYWLRRHGVTNRATERIGQMREARAAGQREIERTCAKHGTTKFILEGRDYYRCARCRAEHVAGRRRKIKQQLVSEAGGRCQICGYDKSVAALHFHHVDPAEKAFGLSGNGATRSIKRARAEAAKCVVLCANCHAEVEAGLASVF